MAQVSRAEVLISDDFDGSNLNTSVWYTECGISTLQVDSSQLILSLEGGYGWFESVNSYAPAEGETLILTTTNCQGANWSNGKAWGFKNVYLSSAGDGLNGVALDEQGNPINYWGDIFIVMTTTGSSADAQYFYISGGNTWNGTFAIEWSAEKVVVKKNSVVVFDSTVNAPDTRYGLGTSTWNIPTAASKVFASTYCGGVLLFENMNLQTYEPAVLPEGVYLHDDFNGNALDFMVWNSSTGLAVGSGQAALTPNNSWAWMESVNSFAPAAGETLVLSTQNSLGSDWGNGKEWGFKNVKLYCAGDALNGKVQDNQGNPINYWGAIFIVMNTTGNSADSQYLNIGGGNAWNGDFMIMWSAQKVTVKRNNVVIFDSTVNAPDSRYGLGISTWNIPTQAAAIFASTYCNGANLVFDNMHLEGYVPAVLPEGVLLSDDFNGGSLNPVTWNSSLALPVSESKVIFAPANSWTWMESIESFAPATGKTLVLTTTNCLASEWGNGREWGFKNVKLSCAGDALNGVTLDELGNPINYWGDVFIVMNTTGASADSQYLKIGNGDSWYGNYAIEKSAAKVVVKRNDVVVFDSSVNAPDSRYGLRTTTWNIPTQAAPVWVSAYVNGTSLAFDNMKLESIDTPVARIPGDANGDRMVDVGDLGILAANYGKLFGANWAQGDFNGDGAVDVGDLGILAANYGTNASSANWSADYAKAFGTSADDDTDDAAGSVCSGLGLPLIAGLALMGLMLVKLEE
jgi:hypothetical protein